MLVTPAGEAWRLPGGCEGFGYDDSFYARPPSWCGCGRKTAAASVAEKARPRGRTADGTGHARYRSIVAARRSFREACVLHQCTVRDGRAIR